MEIMSGTRTLRIDREALLTRIAGRPVRVDLGTGDGRYVLCSARKHPARFWIGVDACRENLRESARRAPPNALFVIANALALPPELAGLADEVTINFPWGSLLRGLLDGDRGLLAGLAATVLPGATLELRLNAGAAEEQGVTLAKASAVVAVMLRRSGLKLTHGAELGSAELRAYPSTWARRLAVSRDPRAVLLRGRFVGDHDRQQLTKLAGEYHPMAR